MDLSNACLTAAYSSLVLDWQANLKLADSTDDGAAGPPRRYTLKLQTTDPMASVKQCILYRRDSLLTHVGSSFTFTL